MVILVEKPWVGVVTVPVLITFVPRNSIREKNPFPLKKKFEWLFCLRREEVKAGDKPDDRDLQDRRCEGLHKYKWPSEF
jgi:hypothetical protein